MTERPRLEAFLEQLSPFITDDDPDLGPAVERWASHRLAHPSYLRGDGVQALVADLRDSSLR